MLHHGGRGRGCEYVLQAIPCRRRSTPPKKYENIVYRPRDQRVIQPYFGNGEGIQITAGWDIGPRAFSAMADSGKKYKSWIGLFVWLQHINCAGAHGVDVHPVGAWC